MNKIFLFLLIVLTLCLSAGDISFSNTEPMQIDIAYTKYSNNSTYIKASDSLMVCDKSVFRDGWHYFLTSGTLTTSSGVTTVKVKSKSPDNKRVMSSILVDTLTSGNFTDLKLFKTIPNKNVEIWVYVATDSVNIKDLYIGKARPISVQSTRSLIDY